MLSERQLTNRNLARSGRNILERRLSLRRQWSSECSIIDNVVDWRRRVESEGALSLADVVSSDCLHSNLGDELTTVVHPQTLTLSILPGAGAGGAGGDPPAGAQGYVNTIHLALVSLVLPQVEVDLRQTAARHALIEELVILIKRRLLDLVHHVSVLTHNLGQGRLPDLSQLGLGEPDRGVRGLVPEPVALLCLLKLYSDDAGEGWTHQSTLERNLAESSSEQVNVLH